MSNPNGPITIKTLATKVGGDMTARRLRVNEKRWGIDKARVATGTRAILYREAEAMAELRKSGLVS